MASTSISTSQSGSIKALTSTKVDAGRTSANRSLCAWPASAQRMMSVSMIRVRTTSPIDAPTWASARSAMSKQRTVWTYRSPTPTVAPSSPIGAVPETATRSPTRRAREKPICDSNLLPVLALCRASPMAAMSSERVAPREPLPVDCSLASDDREGHRALAGRHRQLGAAQWEQRVLLVGREDQYADPVSGREDVVLRLEGPLVGVHLTLWDRDGVVPAGAVLRIRPAAGDDERCRTRPGRAVVDQVRREVRVVTVLDRHPQSYGRPTGQPDTLCQL